MSGGGDGVAQDATTVGSGAGRLPRRCRGQAREDTDFFCPYGLMMIRGADINAGLPDLNFTFRPYALRIHDLTRQFDGAFTVLRYGLGIQEG